MVDTYPQWVFDLRENIDIFAVWEGIGSSTLHMDKVQRELEESTFDPSMMEQKYGVAHVEKKTRHHGVIFKYVPKTFLTAKAMLKIHRHKDDPTGESQALDAVERGISIAETDFEEDSQYKTGDGPL